jgi:LDH2 family malate/lactate/ureidoglycolate dehydrogenase
MSASNIVIAAGVLREFVERIFVAAGVPGEAARLVSDSLVAANLRGVDSHGVQLTLPYLERIDAGDFDARAAGRIVSESGSCLVFDGQNALGQVVAETCCRHAVRLAREYGTSLVLARESNHFGAAAYWGERIRDAGMIGIVLCNASTIVPPWQGRQARLGTNPICAAVPGPWLLDMATTTVAMNRIYKAQMDGYPAIPEGWALDRNGAPTTNVEEAIKGMPMPLGGYKGSGLAVMVEMLGSVLSGGALREEVGGIRLRGHSRTSQTFLAIDIARFMPVDEFTARAEHLVRSIKDTEPAPGYDEILVAGDPEWRVEAERCANGIPLGLGTWNALCGAAAARGVEAPVRK